MLASNRPYSTSGLRQAVIPLFITWQRKIANTQPSEINTLIKIAHHRFSNSRSSKLHVRRRRRIAPNGYSQRQEQCRCLILLFLNSANNIKGGSKHCFRANSEHAYHASTTDRNDCISCSDSIDESTTCQPRLIQHRSQWIDQQCIYWYAK